MYWDLSSLDAHRLLLGLRALAREREQELETMPPEGHEGHQHSIDAINALANRLNGIEVLAENVYQPVLRITTLF